MLKIKAKPKGNYFFMIILEESNPVTTGLSPDQEWLLFKNVYKLFGFRRIPISKEVFVKSQATRHKYAAAVLKKVDSM